MKGKILITGSTGFVGRNLVPKLINEGYELLEITRDISKSTSLFHNNTVKVLADDVNFKEKVIQFQPEVVIHLASYLTPSDNYEDIEKLISTNILFFSKILDAISNVELKLFVNTGTFAEYLNGDNKLIPAYFYAATKTASRSIIEYYSRAYKFNYTHVVPYTIYGGVDVKKKILDLLIQSVDAEKAIDLSPGNQVLDFIHINDVVEFYISLVNQKDYIKNASIIKLGTGKGYSLKEVAGLIETITLKKTKINWGGKSYRDTDVMLAVANTATLRTIINWQPKISLKEYLAELLSKK